MSFKEIFDSFVEHKKEMKVISVASCDLEGEPNSAAKMFVDVVAPNRIFFLDYQFTQTHANILKNPRLSVSFMDDASFTGYRLTGQAEVVKVGEEFDQARKSWEKRLVSYAANRILQRVKGNYSARDAENCLPKDFVIVKLLAQEAAVIKPDRVLRAPQL